MLIAVGVYKGRCGRPADGVARLARAAGGEGEIRELRAAGCDDEIRHALLRTSAPDDGRRRRADQLQPMDVDTTVDVSRGEVQLRSAVAEGDRIEARVQASVHELPRRLADVRRDPDRCPAPTSQHKPKRESRRVVGDALVRRAADGRDVGEPSAGRMALSSARPPSPTNTIDLPIGLPHENALGSRPGGRDGASPSPFTSSRARSARSPRGPQANGPASRTRKRQLTRPVRGSSAHARPSATNDAVASARTTCAAHPAGSVAPEVSFAFSDSCSSPTEHAAGTRTAATRQALPTTRPQYRPPSPESPLRVWT